MKKFINKNVLLLTQGQFISFLGDAIFDFAMSIWILDKTGSTFLMGLTMALLNIPYLLLAPIAGVFSDKHNKKVILITADLLRGILCFFMMWYIMVYGFSILVVLPCSLLIGCISPFFGVTINSLPPMIVGKDDIIKVNSLFSICTSLSNIVGRSSSTFLYYYYGIKIVLLINGISFITTGILEMFITLKNEVKTKLNERTGLFMQYKIAFQQAKEYKGLPTILTYITAFIFLYQMSLTLIIVLFNEDSSLGVLWLGIVSVALMAGMFCVSILLMIVKFKQDTLLKVLIISGRISFFILIPFAFIKNIYWLSSIAFIFGMAFNFILTMLQSTIQRNVSEDSLGKIMGLVILSTQGVAPLGTFVAGVIGELGNIPLLLTLLLIIIFISFCTFSSKIKSMEFVTGDGGIPGLNN